jgi:hypothetical protein
VLTAVSVPPYRRYSQDGDAKWDERNWLQRRDDFPFQPLAGPAPAAAAAAR